MRSQEDMDFILSITDWFNGRWEDPDWGKRPTTQILVALVVRELAMVIQDAELRGQIHASVDKVIINSGQIAIKQ
ncbi:MAG: hypothetical protein FWH56_08040 [Betaproteobacteria bacterium]|nr:hypothetical protein [Betaproteobacteria bacterium]